MATRQSYVHNSIWYNFRGHPENVNAIFSENLCYQTKGFAGFLELIQLYKQNPLDKFFIFTIIYQNYTLALNI